MTIPPTTRSLILVHGAGSGPWIFDDWPASFPGVDVVAVDLQAGLDIGTASMDDYAANVVEHASAMDSPVALCGWSMGGLVALMAAQEGICHRLVLIESSPPGEVQGFDPQIEPRSGTFDPEQVYGTFPEGVASRPESVRARDERKRGISVPSIPCPNLVIYGSEFPEERGARIADFYRCERVGFRELDHWGLIHSPAVREAVQQFIGRS